MCASSKTERAPLPARFAAAALCVAAVFACRSAAPSATETASRHASPPALAASSGSSAAPASPAASAASAAIGQLGSALAALHARVAAGEDPRPAAAFLLGELRGEELGAYFRAAPEGWAAPEDYLRGAARWREADPADFARWLGAEAPAGVADLLVGAWIEDLSPADPAAALALCDALRDDTARAHHSRIARERAAAPSHLPR